MDIVDAQLHFGPTGKTYGPGPLEADSSIITSTLEGMNALGIRSAMIDDHPLLIYWHTHSSGTRRVNCGMRTRVPGIFDPNRITHIEQQMKHEVNASLSAGNDEQLLRVAGRAARANLLGNGFPEPEQARQARVIQPCRRQGAYTLACNLRP